MDACVKCAAPLEHGAAFCPRCGTPRAGDHKAALIGRWVIGQYVIREELGAGGMGVVYLADQPSVGRKAVVKVMHPELSRDPQIAPRFEVEARAASQLNHPHIITIYNYGAMEDGILFLAMEHCDGESLEQALRAGPLSLERATRIGMQIAEALAEAHRHKVIHRDLKPSNIILTRVGRTQDFAKVLDFGIAKLEGVKMTRTGTMIGTPQYMSPEQLRGESVDGRADLYSLGVMLYEMIAGRLPFVSQSTAGYMHKHLNEKPKPLTRIPALRGISPALEKITLRLLEKDQVNRFQDGDELAAALEACLSGEAAGPVFTARPGSVLRKGWVLGVGGSVLAAAIITLVLNASPGEEEQHTPKTPTRKTVAWRETGGPVKGAGVAGEDPVTPAVSGVQPLEADAALSPPMVAAAQQQRPKQAIRRRRPAGRRIPPPSLAKRPRAPATAKEPVRLRAVSKPTKGAGESQGGRGRGVRLTAADREVTGKSAAQMEAKLKKLLSTARVPPSTVDQTFKAYRRARALWPPGRREELGRQYLVQLITTYERPSLQLKPHERKSLAVLERTFLSMEIRNNLTPLQRKNILDSVYKTYDKGNFEQKDKPFYKRMAVLSMIKSYAVKK